MARSKMHIQYCIVAEPGSENTTKLEYYELPNSTTERTDVVCGIIIGYSQVAKIPCKQEE
jgi:hypothetical protein